MNLHQSTKIDREVRNNLTNQLLKTSSFSYQQKFYSLIALSAIVLYSMI